MTRSDNAERPFGPFIPFPLWLPLVKVGNKLITGTHRGHPDRKTEPSPAPLQPSRPQPLPLPDPWPSTCCPSLHRALCGVLWTVVGSLLELTLLPWPVPGASAPLVHVLLSLSRVSWCVEGPSVASPFPVSGIFGLSPAFALNVCTG